VLDRPTISPSRVEPHHQDPTKYNLYSEIEKLTVLNLDLKKQNESLIRELEKQSFLITRIPELETKILDQEKELARKDASLAQALRDVDFLRKDLLNLQKLEPAYNELYAHNKRLLSEIDDINLQYEHTLQDKDRLESELNNLASVRARLDEAHKRIDNLNLELDEKTREIHSLREQNKTLSEKVKLLTYENDRLQNMYNDAQRDINYLKTLQSDMEKGHGEQLMQIADRLENERKTSQQEKFELTTKHAAEKAQLESELRASNQRVEELHTKLTMMVAENEKLHKLNLEANKEIDALNSKLYQNERRAEETQEMLERDKRIQLENQSKEASMQLMQTRQQYEDRIAHLRAEIADLEKLKDVIRDRETDIESLKMQNQYNEKAWERKLQQAVEGERSTLSHKFAVERNELQSEIASCRTRIAELENQLSIMTMEVERLANLHQEKDHELMDHKKSLILQEKDTRYALEELKNHMLLEKKHELEALEMNLRRVHDSQMNMMREKNNSLEEKVMNLVNENSKLAAMNDDRNNEIEMLKYKLQSQEQKHAAYINEMEKRHESNMKYAIEREISACQTKNNVELARLQNKIADLTKEIAALENKAKHQESEINRLNALLDYKHEEIHEEKTKVSAFQRQKTVEVSNLQDNLETVKRATIEVATVQSRFEAERAALAAQIKQQKERIDELEKRLTLMVEENERLRNLYTERVDDLEALRKTLVELQDSFDKEKGQLETEIENLNFARLDIQELTVKHSSEKAQYENQIRQLKTLYDNGKEELDKLYDLMAQRKKEHEAQVKLNDALKREVDKLTEQITQVSAESNTQKDRNDLLHRKMEELEKDRNVLQGKLNKYDNELARINNELLQKCKELDALRKKYEKSMETCAQLSTQLMNRLMKNE